MRTLHRYIARSFLTTFLMALLVLSFVMWIALIFKVTQYIARGMSMRVVMDFLWGGIPGTLSYTIPIAALVTTILVFGRLSSDNEISAMRACGISLTRIMRTPVLIAAFLSVFCLYLNNDVSPESAYIRSSSRKQVKGTDLAALIEPGKFVEIGEHSVYVGSHAGDELEDLRINKTLDDGDLLTIRAKTATIISSESGTSLDMRNVSMDPIQQGHPGVGWADRVVYNLTEQDSKPAAAPGTMRKRRIKDKHTWVLAKDIIVSTKYPPLTRQGIVNISRSRMEIASRISLALACFCFVAVAAPLSIKNKRSESSRGIAICLAVASAFYLFAIAGESLAKNPSYHAHFLPLVPVIACLVMSFVFTSKNN